MSKKTTPDQHSDSMLDGALKKLFTNEIERALVNINGTADLESVRCELRVMSFQELAGCIDATIKALVLKLTNDTFEQQHLKDSKQGGMIN